METGELAEEIFVTFCESPSYLSVMQCAAPDGVQVTQQTAAFISDDDHVNALEEGSTAVLQKGLPSGKETDSCW